MYAQWVGSLRSVDDVRGLGRLGVQEREMGASMDRSAVDFSYLGLATHGPTGTYAFLAAMA